MKKSFKYLFYLFMLPLLSLIIYLSIAYVFTLFPKTGSNNAEKSEQVYLLYSDMHTDIVLDIQEINSSLFPAFKQHQIKKHQKGYLAFGWGDQETYLNTPTWDDLSITTSMKALFINTPTLIHVSYLPNVNRYSQLKTIPLSKKQKRLLIENILKTFNFNGKQYKGYGREDFFYTAKGAYNLINTCNTWTGDQLREANVTMPYWTPFAQSVTAMFP